MQKAVDKCDSFLYYKQALTNCESNEEKLRKKSKKLLTSENECDIVNELALISNNSTLTNKQQCNPERFRKNEMKGHLIWKKFREQNLKQ